MENTNTRYEVRYYPPDGHGVPTSGPMAVDGEQFETLEDARIAVGQALGCKTYGKWSGLAENGDVEAWHENNKDGCGGYAIRVVTF